MSGKTKKENKKNKINKKVKKVLQDQFGDVSKQLKKLTIKTNNTGGKVMAGMKSKYGAKMGGTPMKSKYAAKAGGLVKKKNGGSTAKMIPGMARRNQARKP